MLNIEIYTNSVDDFTIGYTKLVPFVDGILNLYQRRTTDDDKTKRLVYTHKDRRNVCPCLYVFVEVWEILEQIYINICLRLVYCINFCKRKKITVTFKHFIKS